MRPQEHRQRLTRARFPYRIGAGDMAAQHAVLQQHGQMVGLKSLRHKRGKADPPHGIVQHLGPVLAEMVGHIHDRDIMRLCRARPA